MSACVSSSLAPSRLVIASRESRLAMWRAEHVRVLFQELDRSAGIVVDPMTTRGDPMVDRALKHICGKSESVGDEVARQLFAQAAERFIPNP